MGTLSFSTGFQHVDRSGGRDVYVNYLDTISPLEAIRAYKQQTFSRLEVHDGDHLLEIGCGTGDDAQSLARSVGTKGKVVGIDNSEMMIAEARSRVSDADLPVEFHPGDAHEIPFPNNSFDGCRADRTFQHLEDPRYALSELIRVARPGARIVISDPDWETLTIDSGNRASTRAIINWSCDSVRNGWIGRQMPGFFRQAGFVEIAVDPIVLILTNFGLASQIFGFDAAVQGAQRDGVISEDQATNWLSDMQDADRSGQFFSSLTGFIVSACKP